jgi:hypothetical protein
MLHSQPQTQRATAANKILAAISEIACLSDDDSGDQTTVREIRINFDKLDFFLLFPKATRHQCSIASLAKTTKVACLKENFVQRLTPVFQKEKWFLKFGSDGFVGAIHRIRFTLLQRAEIDHYGAFSIKTFLSIKFHFSTTTVDTRTDSASASSDDESWMDPLLCFLQPNVYVEQGHKFVIKFDK